MSFIRKLQNIEGFASFEFAWVLPIFAFLFIVFFDLFNLFHVTARTLIGLHESTFQTVGQNSSVFVSSSGGGVPGMIYEGELATEGGNCQGPATCNVEGENYILRGNLKRYTVFGNLPWQPTLEMHLDLDPL